MNKTEQALRPTEQQARDMGAKGAPADQHERKLFEAWMAGHCWALCATWDGESYRGNAEHGEYIDPRAMLTRQLWAAWRDRAALPQSEAPAEQPECKCDMRTKLVGDGCSVCNPELAAEYAKDTEQPEDEQERFEAWEQQFMQQRGYPPKPLEIWQAAKRDASAYGSEWHSLIISLGCLFDFDTSGSAEEIGKAAAARRDALAKAKKPVDQENARFAIEGAIEYGRRNINPPPSDDHWLAPFWNIGRQLGAPQERAAVTDEHVLRTWEHHVNWPNDKYPLTEKDILVFSRALLSLASSEGKKP